MNSKQSTLPFFIQRSLLGLKFPVRGSTGPTIEGLDQAKCEGDWRAIEDLGLSSMRSSRYHNNTLTFASLQ